MENGRKNQYCTHPAHYFYRLSRIWLRKVKKFMLIEPFHFCASTLSSARFHFFKIFCQKCPVKLMLGTSYWGFSLQRIRRIQNLVERLRWSLFVKITAFSCQFQFQLLTVNYFHKKNPSQMFDQVLTTPMQSIIIAANDGYMQVIHLKKQPPEVLYEKRCS